MVGKAHPTKKDQAIVAKEISITLEDGKQKTCSQPINAGEIIKDLNLKKVVAACFDGQPVDLTCPLENSGTLAFITLDSVQGREILRHSTAHIMAQAVTELFPGTKLAIGPAIEEGFYYDFDCPQRFSEEDLIRIEKRMQEIIEQKLPFARKMLDKKSAWDFFRQNGEIYKTELIEELQDGTISLYQQGDFIDLCRGPHLPATGWVPAFKLLSIAGAYWRGSEKNKMLQRIYGTAFASAKELADYLHKIEEAQRRDHRKLGRELDLFSFQEEAGAGLVIYHPKGALLRATLEEFERKEHLKRGYQLAVGPQILKLDLWKKSGHYDNYRENMYFTEIEGEKYGIKPMNCLAHMLIYKSRLRSYRDLPLRYFELGTVYRHEKSGVLHGLLRVRGFTQDDAHILCTPDQLNDEIKGVIKFVQDVMAIFGFDYTMEISTRPEKSIGSDQDWERATNALMLALRDTGLAFAINEGDGAFYGPKIDVKLKDALGRSWQCATIQCDFTLPERFDLKYIGADGAEHRPVMLHRVILGALERFMGVLIEHYAGAFPVWLAPEQVRILTITDAQKDYAQVVESQLREHGIRVSADLRQEKIGLKIREAQLEKIPYMLIAGNKEIAEQKVSVRSRKDGDLGGFSLYQFIDRIKQEIEGKK
ncbi:MAG: threonine--tRNA ligase [Candidatus Schekmanbacteria bacterium]|nr:threonine--tRNA ligase [Candidatus Schekmanbacteria bacterium]